MDANDLIKKTREAIADVEMQQVTEIYGRLVELFAEMKEIQPHLEYMWSGMGTMFIVGDYYINTVDCVGAYDEDDQEAEVLNEWTDEDGDKRALYKVRVKRADFLDMIEHDDHSCLLEGEGIDDYLNDACFEFKKLCDYILNINCTTNYHGVNENGVIVPFGRNLREDTFVDARESDSVEYLTKNNVPFQFLDGDSGTYFTIEYCKYCKCEMVFDGKNHDCPICDL